MIYSTTVIYYSLCGKSYRASGKKNRSADAWAVSEIKVMGQRREQDKGMVGRVQTIGHDGSNNV